MNNISSQTARPRKASPVPVAPHPFSPRLAVGRLWRVNAPLTLTGLSMAAVFLACLVGLALDPRVVTGAPLWLKPAKFAVSLSLYAFTFVWLLGFVHGRRKPIQIAAGLAAGATALASVVELLVIGTQAARGTASHFNVATPLDTTLFGLMGAFVLVLWLANLLAAILLLTQRLENPVFGWALRLGLVLTLVGASVGALMTRPSSLQQGAWAAGQTVTVVGAHSVGVTDGGPGLPVLGWSTRGGDLRAAHFVGLHALQVLPLVGWLFSRRRPGWLGEGHRVSLIWVAGFAYLGLIGLLTWQALRGQSVVAPDTLTVAGLTGLAGAAILAAAAVVLHARGRAGPAGQT